MKSILETIMEEKERHEALDKKPYELILELIKELRDNERDVLTRRFGLSGEPSETLENVGRSRGVTRERIRQIEKNSLKKLKQIFDEKKELKALESTIIKILEEYGGLMAEKHLLDMLLEIAVSDDKQKDTQAILFALNYLFKEPNLLKKDPEFHDSWYLSETSLDDIKNIISQIEEKIKEKKELIDEDGLRKIFDTVEVDEKPFESYLNATKKIEKNNFGEWGIATWTTVNPKRIGDKAYLVLKKLGKPLHFEKITEEINKASFDDQKIANVGTVHNELIMDKRYVLIGRGTYALREWGYYPGTVKELIIRLLKERQEMGRDEIVDAVVKQRLVNENTVKVALMDKGVFKKIGKNRYELALI